MIYDSVIIGTSPVSILEALYRSEQGEKILLVDQASSIGGAWRTVNCFGLDGVETSPHILLPNRIAYRILREKIGVKLTPVVPEPVYIIGNKKRSLKHLGKERMLRELAGLHRYKFPQKMLRIAGAIYHSLRFCGTNYRVDIHYPESGLNRLLQKSEQKLKESGVEILLNQTIDDVCYDTAEDAGIFTLLTDNGDAIKSRKVASSAIVGLKTIRIDDKTIQPFSYISQSDHITYLIDSSQSVSYGFAKLIDNEYFELVNDVTDYTPDFGKKYTNKRIITCRFRKDRYFDRANAVVYLENLKSIGYLHGDESMVDSHYFSNEDKILSGYVISRVKNLLGNKYEFIGSTDLGMTDSLDEYNVRWAFCET